MFILLVIWPFHSMLFCRHQFISSFLLSSQSSFVVPWHIITMNGHKDDNTRDKRFSTMKNDWRDVASECALGKIFKWLFVYFVNSSFWRCLCLAVRDSGMRRASLLLNVFAFRDYKFYFVSMVSHSGFIYSPIRWDILKRIQIYCSNRFVHIPRLAMISNGGWYWILGKNLKKKRFFLHHGRKLELLTINARRQQSS